MGFFKEFKDDLTQAVNELLPDGKTGENETQDDMVNTLDADDNSDDEKLREWLESFAEGDEESVAEPEVGQAGEEPTEEEAPADQEITGFDEDEADIYGVEGTQENNGEEGENMEDNVDLELLEALKADEETETATEQTETPAPKVRATSVNNDDDVTVISKGTTINGSISTDGSLDVMGTITGDIECLGKLSITGKVKGNSTAAEVYINTDRLEGSVTSEGSVKVGLGTVVIGDITGTSAVIAGAVKGEIDINGPIVIDSTSIIKGNIKAKSVQINNGAVIEGFCSLSYSAVDVDNIFE